MVISRKVSTVDVVVPTGLLVRHVSFGSIWTEWICHGHLRGPHTAIRSLFIPFSSDLKTDRHSSATTKKFRESISFYTHSFSHFSVPSPHANFSLSSHFALRLSEEFHPSFYSLPNLQKQQIEKEMVRERGKRAVLPPSQENIEKLEKTVNDGNYYEAQQMYKSVSARYVAAERCAEALDILQSGASIQLRNGQVTCGSELAVLFAETLIKGKFQCSEETLDRVRKIYQEFPRITLPHHLGDEDDDEMQKLSEAMVAAKTRVEGCSSFLKAAIRWSAEFGAPRNGSPELHDMLAEYFYTESPEMDMARVSFHFVRGSNPEKFAATLVNFMGKCYPGEDDLAIARAILMYLSLGNLRDANRLMDELKIQLKSKQLDFPKSDLIQFIVYVVKTLERDALPLFRILRQNYKLSIERDPAFDELLDDIAEKFYGIKRRSVLQGMFGDFFNV